MNFRNPPFFTLNFSLLTSVSRTLLLLAMAGAWAAVPDTSAQAGEIHEAVKAGNVAKLKQLLADNPQLVNERDKNGGTAIIRAAEKGKTELVELLVAHKADANARESVISYSALHFAAVRGDTKVATLLLMHGADVNAKDKWGHTPLHAATGSNRLKMVKLLLAHKADINAKGEDRDGVSALHGAAYLGFKEMVTLLLSHGADINAKEKHGLTPLDVAETYRKVEIVKLLRAHGGRSGKEQEKP